MKENKIKRIAYRCYLNLWNQDEYNKYAQAYGIESPKTFYEYVHTSYLNRDEVEKDLQEMYEWENPDKWNLVERRINHLLFYYGLYQTKRLVDAVCIGG